MSELIITEKDNLTAIANAVRNTTDSTAELTLDEIAENINLMTGFIPTPATAEVGQTIKVKTVDSDGKPIEWEAADMGSDTKYSWKQITNTTLQERVSRVEITADNNGNPFSTKAMIVAIANAATSANTADGSGHLAIMGTTPTGEFKDCPLALTSPYIYMQ